ncbi:BTAD domain-containing putative transcriptional regulator [Rhodovulum sp. YNF3179]|uniref:BTAD domain-containing putative transcriptional regulator n=1 Tax=Rhodovulum sp. YNF3179 TaxID=3425127 RepID=UPI003D336645
MAFLPGLGGFDEITLRCVREADGAPSARKPSKVDLRSDNALTLRLLGPFAIEGPGSGDKPMPRKAQAMLAYLARRPGVSVPRETLTAMLWSDSEEEQARASLRTALSSLRKSMGPVADVVEASNAGIRIDDERIVIDADLFMRTARHAEDVDALTRATELHSGAFLEGLPAVTAAFDQWVEAERGTIRSQYMSVLLRLTDALFEAGDTEGAVATAQKLLSEDPLQEHVHRRLIRVYAKQRRFDAALKQFDRLRSLLDEELGVQPEPPTMELVREVRRARSGGQSKASGPGMAPQASLRGTPELPRAPGRPSIAVLPFRTLSKDAEAGFFGDGIAEDVIVELSRNPDLLVVARQSSFRFSEEEDTPEEIGERLGVRFLLGGSVRLANDRLRVTAHLVRCSDQRELWAERYDRDIEDIFEIQAEIARSVTGAAVGRIVETEANAALEFPRDRLEGFALISRGLRHMNIPELSEFDKALECFGHATEVAPQNARGWALLALTRLYRQWYFQIEGNMAELIPLGERAVALDPREPRAHCVLGVARMLERDFDRAAHHFEAGLAVNPNDDLLLTEYGRFLMYDDRPEEGLQRIREGMRLNPYHPNWYWGMQGRCLHTLGRFSEARDAFLRMRNPPFYTYAYLAACHLALGDGEAAQAAHASLYRLKPDFDIDAFRTIFPYRNPETAKRFWATMVAAGLDAPPQDLQN